MTRHSIRSLALTVATCIFFLSGCSQAGPDYGSLNLSSGHGKIALDGEPLPEALVLFEADDQTYSFALTDNGGHYELMFNSEKPGVTKGPKTVRIWSARGIPGMAEAGSSEDEGDPDAKPDETEKVPPRYNVQSELSVTVQKDAEQFDFDLQSR